MTSFEESFWGEDGTGFEVLSGKFSRGNASLKEVILYFKERAAIEERYSKDLLKLNATCPMKSDDGTVRTALQQCHISTEGLSRIHSELAAKIVDEVVQPLEAFRGSLKKEHKMTEESYIKAVKNLAKESTNVEKARLNYVAKSKERDKAEQSQAAAGGKDAKKSNEKLSKLEKETHSAVTDYRRSIADWEKVRDKWVEEMKASCNNIQRGEEQRIKFIRSVLISIYNWQMREATEHRKKSNETFYEFLELINASKDIQSFISNCRTGSIEELPPAPTFRHYSEKYITPEQGHTLVPSSSLHSLPDEASLQTQPEDEEASPTPKSPRQHISASLSLDGFGDAPSKKKRTSLTNDDANKKSSLPLSRESKEFRQSDSLPKSKSEGYKTFRQTIAALNDKSSSKPSHQKSRSKDETSSDSTSEPFPETATPGDLASMGGVSKSLPLLAIDHLESERQKRTGSFSMVNPLAAANLINAQQQGATMERIQMFRDLHQKSSNKLENPIVSPEKKAPPSSRNSILAEGWLCYRSQLEGWKRSWASVEGGYLWFFLSPEDNLQPPGLNSPKMTVPLKGCALTSVEGTIGDLASLREGSSFKSSWEEQSSLKSSLEEQSSLKSSLEEQSSLKSSLEESSTMKSSLEESSSLKSSLDESKLEESLSEGIDLNRDVFLIAIRNGRKGISVDLQFGELDEREKWLEVLKTFVSN